MRQTIILAKMFGQMYWPHATPRAQRRQYFRLLRAKQWMRQRKIDALLNPEFVYKPATGSVL